MVRSNRTCTLIFDPEVERTARRLRKETSLRKAQASSSTQVNIEPIWETESEDGSEDLVMEQPPQNHNQPPQPPQNKNLNQHEDKLNNLGNLNLNLNLNLNQEPIQSCESHI